MINSITFLSVLFLLAVCAIKDYSENRVPNYFTFPFMGAGLILSLFVSKSVFFERLIWMIVFFFIGTLGIMGMGDLKLFMAIIALRGITEASVTMFFAAVLMLFYCLMERPKEAVTAMKYSFRSVIRKMPINTEGSKKYPFAVFIALAYPLTYLLTNVR